MNWPRMVLTGAHRAKWPLRAIVLLVLLAAQLLRPGCASYADEPIQVLSNSGQVRFATDITFRLEVKAPSGVREVTLYYQQLGEGLIVKVPIVVESGASSFVHTWGLEPGDIPVGARLEYYWRIIDSAGNELKTFPTDLDYADDRFTWQTVREGNIALQWYGNNRSQGETLLGYASEALARLQGELGVTVNQPITIWVYQSKADMSLALPSKSESYDDRILTLGVVVDDGTLLILGSHADVEQTIAHELAHVVVGLATDNPYAELPRWLDEGLAMNAEGQLPSGNRQALEAAIRRDALISVRSLSGYTGDPSEVDLFYGEVYNLVDYMLQTFGKDKMADLLNGIRAGMYQEDALQQVYGFGLDELDSRWRQSLGLGPRPTPDPNATSSPTPRPAQRPQNPCSSALLGGLLGVVALAGRKRNAGTS
jgi:hypothetical protein